MPELTLPLAAITEIMNVLVVIVGIGLLIFVHELGHFLVAKWNKVRVEAFSLGFGPVLLGFRRGDTHYRLSLIPLGGYVKMAGETPGDAHSDDPAEFQNKSIGARAAILVAGVAMNAVVGILLFVLAFNVGVPLQAPVVGRVTPGSPAWEAGIEPGDRILEIGGETILDFEDLASEVVFSRGPVDIRLVRDGKEILIPHVEPTTSSRLNLRTIGVEPRVESVVQVDEGSAAYEAGMRTGDKIIRVGGRDVAGHGDLLSLIGRAGRKKTTFTVRRGEEELTFSVTPELVRGERPLVGITPLASRVAVRPSSPAESAGLESGDEFVEVNGKPAASWYRARTLAADEAPRPVTFTVRRDGKEIAVGPITGIGEASGWEDWFEDLAPVPGDLKTARVSLIEDDAFEDGNPARKAGLVQGAKLLTVNGKPVKTFEDIQNAISGVPESDPVRIVFEADGEKRGPVEVVRRPQVLATFGLAFPPLTEKVRVEGLFGSVRAGFKRSTRMANRILQFLSGIFSGRVSAKAIQGPIGIARLSYAHAEKDIVHFLYFLGILSINLAILNLLPIPVLDGGHLFFILIEAVRGKPLPERSMALFQWAGLLVLVLLMVFVVANDLTRIFQ